MSEKWYDKIRKSCDSFAEGMQLLENGVPQLMVDTTQSVLNRKLDEGFRLTSPIKVVEYGVGHRPDAGVMSPYFIYVISEAEIEHEVNL